MADNNPTAAARTNKRIHRLSPAPRTLERPFVPLLISFNYSVH